MGSAAAWCSAASPAATRHSGIREVIVSDNDTISLAVWDVPMPVTAGEKFAVKIGAKSSSRRELAGYRVAVTDVAGVLAASGALGTAPLPGTEALYWTMLEVTAPARQAT